VLRVGLTGGLASGKSSVADCLRQLGAAVFDADAIVAELYQPGRPGADAARELFGDEVLDAEGRADRARIARIVFADPERRRRLEARLHPLVREEIARSFEEAQRRGAEVAVAEASQLLEAGSESQLDRILLVVAPEAERLRRWQREGGDPADARARMAAQLPEEQARRRVHDVLVNDGTLEQLRDRVAELYRRWLQSAPRPDRGGSDRAAGRSRGPSGGPETR
jgi:dephospho-CoA kinase